jgi:hypothetical protein
MAVVVNCRLTHVIIPGHIGQLPNIKTMVNSWESMRPCDSLILITKPVLIFLIAISNSDAIEVTHTCRKMFYSINARHCFSAVDVHLVHMENNQNNHNVGSRLLFNSMLNATSYRNTVAYVLYIEADVVAVQQNWLHPIIKYARTTFWIAGSLYRGSQNIDYGDNLFRYHINGNAIYNVGDAKFVDFYFTSVLPWIKARHDLNHICFDLDITTYLHTAGNFDTARHVLHNIQYTNLIQNIYFRDLDDLARAVKKSPDTVLIHMKI